MTILVKNISPDIIKALKAKLPAVSLSLIIRALLSFGSQLSTDNLMAIVNKQAELETSQKGK